MSQETPPPSSTPPSDAPPPGPVGYPGPYAGPAPDKDAISMGMLAHLLGLFTVFLGPLIIWLMKKDTNPFVDDQGKEALNFQITAMIATLCCVIGCMFAPILIGIVQIIRIVFSIIGTINANKGIAYRYPVTLRLIK